MSKSQGVETAESEIIQVRYGLPKDVHDKIKSHKRILAAKTDRDVDMEEALIDFVRKAQLQ
jgi:hypothetical protein